MTRTQSAALNSFRLKMLSATAVILCSLSLTGCGGGGQSTKVEMPENATPLPDESMRREYGGATSKSIDLSK